MHEKTEPTRGRSGGRRFQAEGIIKKKKKAQKPGGRTWHGQGKTTSVNWGPEETTGDEKGRQGNTGRGPCEPK